MKWFALRKAKKLEKQHIPTTKEIKQEEKEFELEVKSMKRFITKRKTTKKKAN